MSPESSWLHRLLRTAPGHFPRSFLGTGCDPGGAGLLAIITVLAATAAVAAAIPGGGFQWLIGHKDASTGIAILISVIPVLALMGPEKIERKARARIRQSREASARNQSVASSNPATTSTIE